MKIKKKKSAFNLSQVRAGVRTFKPKETQLMEENAKFSKKVMKRPLSEGSGRWKSPPHFPLIQQRCGRSAVIVQRFYRL